MIPYYSDDSVTLYLGDCLVQPHCEGRTCGWVRCRSCNSIIGRNRFGRSHLCDSKTTCKEDA